MKQGYKPDSAWLTKRLASFSKIPEVWDYLEKTEAQLRAEVDEYVIHGSDWCPSFLENRFVIILHTWDTPAVYATRSQMARANTAEEAAKVVDAFVKSYQGHYWGRPQLADIFDLDRDEMLAWDLVPTVQILEKGHGKEVEANKTPAPQRSNPGATAEAAGAPGKVQGA